MELILQGNADVIEQLIQDIESAFPHNIDRCDRTDLEELRNMSGFEITA